MHDVFISHAEEDGGDAVSLAQELTRAGYTSWYYERDATVGGSYLQQVADAIEQCQVFLLIISRHSLASIQVGHELIHAFENQKQLIPLLKGLNFNDFLSQKRDWKIALGPSVAKQLETSTINVTAGELLVAFKEMGLKPGPSAAPSTSEEIFVRLQLMPEAVVRRLRPLVGSSDLHCTYRLLLKDDPGPAAVSPAQIVLMADGMFINLRQVQRGAFVQIRISYYDQSWESAFLPVDCLPVTLFPDNV